MSGYLKGSLLGIPQTLEQKGTCNFQDRHRIPQLVRRSQASGYESCLSGETPQHRQRRWEDEEGKVEPELDLCPGPVLLRAVPTTPSQSPPPERFVPTLPEPLGADEAECARHEQAV